MRSEPSRRRSVGRGLFGLAAAGVLSVVLAGGVAAECGCPGAHDGPDLAAAGNGGTATASAVGGVVVIGDVNSGLNTGSTIVVGAVAD